MQIFISIFYDEVAAIVQHIGDDVEFFFCLIIVIFLGPFFSKTIINIMGGGYIAEDVMGTLAEFQFEIFS